MPEFTLRQKWNNYIAMFLVLLGFIAGLYLKSAILDATITYQDAEAGIKTRYPQNWFIDFDGDYIFRVRDIAHIGYKTTLQVSTQALGTNTTSRNIFDAINLRRYSVLAAYKVLSVDNNFLLANETQASAMQYAYAESGNNNASLQELPVIVRGMDILIIQRGEAIIITFLADAGVFEREYYTFETFLANLTF